MSSSDSSGCFSSCSSEGHHPAKEKEEQPFAVHRHTKDSGPCDACEHEAEKVSESSDDENASGVTGGNVTALPGRISHFDDIKHQDVRGSEVRRVDKMKKKGEQMTVLL